MTKIAYLVACLGIASSACSSQVDPDYRGEPLAVITGAVSSDEVQLDGLVPVLGWYDFARQEDDSAEDKSDAQPALLQEVETEGVFPNRFTMRLYDLPPEGALFPARDGEPAMALGMIFAAKRDADWSERFGARPEWLAGAAVNYMVLYLDGSTLPDGPAARFFGMQLDRGFHLIEVRERTEQEVAEKLACEEAAFEHATATFNARHGTTYTDCFEAPDDAGFEECAALHDEEDEQCPSKASMTVVPSGLDHPIELHIGRDLQFVDWM